MANDSRRHRTLPQISKTCNLQHTQPRVVEGDVHRAHPDMHRRRSTLSRAAEEDHCGRAGVRSAVMPPRGPHVHLVAELLPVPSLLVDRRLHIHAPRNHGPLGMRLLWGRRRCTRKVHQSRSSRSDWDARQAEAKNLPSQTAQQMEIAMTSCPALAPNQLHHSPTQLSQVDTTRST